MSTFWRCFSCFGPPSQQQPSNGAARQGTPTRAASGASNLAGQLSFRTPMTGRPDTQSPDQVEVSMASDATSVALRAITAGPLSLLQEQGPFTSTSSNLAGFQPLGQSSSAAASTPHAGAPAPVVPVTTAVALGLDRGQRKSNPRTFSRSSGRFSRASDTTDFLSSCITSYALRTSEAGSMMARSSSHALSLELPPSFRTTNTSISGVQSGSASWPWPADTSSFYPPPSPTQMPTSPQPAALHCEVLYRALSRDPLSCTSALESAVLENPEDLLAGVSELQCIKTGQSGAVYSGMWQGQQVAVKFVTSPTLTSDSIALREALLGRELIHPNVIRTFTSRVALCDSQLASDVHWHRTASSTRGSGLQTDTGLRRSSSAPGQLYLSTVPEEALREVSQLKGILMDLQVSTATYVTMAVMEFCDRGTLEVLTRADSFNPVNSPGAASALLHTATEIASALQYLHGCNIMHGDLKPANVLLKSVDDPDAIPKGVGTGSMLSIKVADFGQSQVMIEGQQPSLDLGTIAYAAPERLETHGSKASDVYSFGILMWQMASGKKPFADRHMAQIMYGVTQQTLSLEWPVGRHEHLKDLFLRCTAHNVADRPTITQVIQELRAMRRSIQEARTSNTSGTDIAASTSTIVLGAASSNVQPHTSTNVLGAASSNVQPQDFQDQAGPSNMQERATNSPAYTRASTHPRARGGSAL